ncbi:TonB-dependent receptor [Fulvivirga imtechensis AK7]|uniref:TonB-dependent receptor n=1 Tax=Fulvivirga imtechensis AK7 TaxID=1237149 RepID=L8JUV7_9BACT|nr:TonB-dependent receptor [Fulvivirga imtechensis]ELR72018.1 TonB-dependent receptor [Fulvivirga imtechensis AK7]
MKQLTVIAMVVLWATTAFGQKLTQTVRGVITDRDSKSPLIGATVVVQGSDPLIGAITDENGTFRLVYVPLGRISLQLSYVGYEPEIISNVIVNSGKEVVLALSMEESAVKMDEIVVTAVRNKGEAVNDMALVSARSISAEETNRYAGGFNDPSRIMSNFAGITSTQDGSNDIIVRGNSPKYVQWRLEGVQITNPNHFADQSAVGGAISTLNNNLLATSDFYTGAFSPEFGDVLSGVYDVRLRAGNNEKFESVFGFGLLGTDLTLEGPLKKGYGGSYLVNYRYSTATIIKDLGLVDINGVPKFQDAAFKIVLPTEKLGSFSLFGLSGLSSFLIEDVTPVNWETPGDRFMREDIEEDYKKGAHLLNLGIDHIATINNNSFINTTIAYSNEGINDDVFESQIEKIYDDEGNLIGESVADKRLNLKSRLAKTTYRGAITYHNKINARNKFQLGTTYAYFDYNYEQSRLRDDASSRFTLLDFNDGVSTIRNFISWKYRVSGDIAIVAGFHNMNVLLNNKSTLEPRVALNWQMSNTSSVHFGYGKHSNMESIHNYFAQVEHEDGSITKPNKDLGLLKANHYVVGYEKRMGRNLRAKVEAYYQGLYDIPVENSDTSYYSTINEGLEFRYIDLVNKGTGKNYGIEVTLEKFFDNQYYYLINGSLYESKYTALDGVERNTQYNGNYLLNILFGKEFTRLGKKRNQTLGLNGKVFFGGGKKIIPLLRDENGHLAVDPQNNRYWDYEKAYEHDLEDVYAVIISASYKWNRPKATHELFLNLDNITDHKGRLSEFYDASEPGSVGYVTQFGFFPNLMYRVYF